MNATRYTLISDPDVDATLDCVLPEISAEIEELRLPKLRAVVLGGGYGRGEGGVLHTPEGGRLYNDLDFFVFSEDAGPHESARIDRELKAISARWEKELGVSVDFGPVKELSSLKSVRRTLMFQELRHGWIKIWGDADLRDWLDPLDAARLPYSEAVRLLLNRGMGLLLAGEYLKNGKDDPDFIVRNMNKAYLGGGDAILIAAGEYCWRGPDRVAAFRTHVRKENLSCEYASLYEKAFRWKLEPDTAPLPDPADAWRRCRGFYLDSVALCAGAVPGTEISAVVRQLRQKTAGERSLKNGLRRLLRGHALRPLQTLWDPPVGFVLEMLYRLLAGNSSYPEVPPRLRRLWEIFN